MKTLGIYGDEFVIRGRRPETDEEFRYLSTTIGVNVLLNLEYGWREFLTGTTNREAIRAISSMIVPVNIELSNLIFPSEDAIDAAVNLISECRADRLKIYIHCKDSKDRTGIVWAAYRVRSYGWSVDGAMDEMLALGFHRYRYAHWLPRIRKYLTEIGLKSR